MLEAVYRSPEPSAPWPGAAPDPSPAAAPTWGAPVPGYPPPQPPPGRRGMPTGLWIGLGALAVLLVLVCFTGGWFVASSMHRAYVVAAVAEVSQR